MQIGPFGVSVAKHQGLEVGRADRRIRRDWLVGTPLEPGMGQGRV